MPAQPATIKISDSVATKLNDLRSLVCSQPVVDLACGLLSETELTAFEKDQNARRNFAAFWSKTRKISLARAVLDIAWQTDLLSTASHARLRKEISEPVGQGNLPIATDASKPHWDPERGRLLLGGKLIRTVRVCATPSRPQRVLDAFEAAGWPAAISQPIENADAKTVHQVVYQLNKGLKRLAFQVHQGGRQISWQLRK